MWRTLVGAATDGSVVGCSSAWARPRARGRRGVIDGRAYAVLEARSVRVAPDDDATVATGGGASAPTATSGGGSRRARKRTLQMVKVFNPWGQRVWRGEWHVRARSKETPMCMGHPLTRYPLVVMMGLHYNDRSFSFT